MRLEPCVKLSRKEALRNPSSKEASPGDEHHSHQEEAAHLAHSGALDKALGGRKVQGGHIAAQVQAQAQAREHPCSCLPVPLCHNDGRNAQDTDGGEVEEPWLWGAIGVVEPGDKAPRNQ